MKNDDDPLNSLPQREWDRFIGSILRPFLGYAKHDPLISGDDLKQEAWVALMHAARNYDPRKAKFTTYAYFYVRGRIFRYVLEKTRMSSMRIDTDPMNVEEGYTDNTYDDQELMGTILSVISDEPHVNLLVEHFVKGKSFRKIAKENGMSHQIVAMHVKKLVNLLEKRLDHENA